MFSTTTMPLSTSMPRASTKAKSTITLKVMPKAFRMAKLKNMDSGMATPTKRALRSPRKKSRTPTTSRTPRMMLF